MDLQTMYPAKLGSPQTILAADLAADATSMVLSDASILPAAPNIAVIGSDENCEIISYSNINNNTVTISERGIGGSIAKAWANGSTVARNHTSLDHNTLVTNIGRLNTGKAENDHNHDTRYYTETEIDTTLSAKANNSLLADAFSTSKAYAIGDYCIYQGALYRFTSAHSAGAWDSSHVTQVVAMNELAALSAQVASRMDFKITGTVSASNYTLTDSRINNEHWEVLSIYFETPGNVTTQIHWTTDITNHTVSLSATYAGSTNVVVKMHWVQ